MTIHVGDCIEVMAGMSEASVDAIVCDPPYGLGFMGQKWDTYANETGRKPAAGAKFDHVGGNHNPTSSADASRTRAVEAKRFGEWCEAWAIEALRILKPGGHLLAFGGTRTYHRLACAVEDAGFEIRDQLAWLYGSGFPKSLDVSKAIDKAAGAEREVVGTYSVPADSDAGNAGQVIRSSEDASSLYGVGTGLTEGRSITAPATPDAETWQGWGTALKPAHEPIVLARKPLMGTVASNVLAHGTGALNVDGCRITATDDQLAQKYASVQNAGPRENAIYGTDDRDRAGAAPHEAGRWPANVLLDEEAAALLDEQTGELTSGDLKPYREQHENASSYRMARDKTFDRAGDSGGASRFFYCAKSSSAERNAGLDGFEEQEGGAYAGGEGMPGRTLRDGEWVQTDLAQRRPRANVHPTVKPIELMRWLIRLVTPLGGTILDPFTGSGTTGCAAALEGFTFIGIEREAEYAAIAEARIAWWEQHPDGVAIVKALEWDRKRTKVADSGQMGLL